MFRPVPLLVAVLALGALTACGSSAKGLLPTGSILGGSSAKQLPAAVGTDPTQRPIQVGWVSARASKCGFYFAPDTLKSKYLAAEAATGISVEQLKKLDLTYEYSRKSTAIRIAGMPDYCTDARAAKIRKDLQRHLAGDFTPSPRPKVVPEKSFWDVGPTKTKKFSHESVFAR